MIIVLWSGSKDEGDDNTKQESEENGLKMRIKKARQQVRDSSDLIDASDSDE